MTTEATDTPRHHHCNHTISSKVMTHKMPFYIHDSNIIQENNWIINIVVVCLIQYILISTVDQTYDSEQGNYTTVTWSFLR